MGKVNEIRLKKKEVYDGKLSGYGGVGMDGWALGSINSIGLNLLDELLSDEVCMHLKHDEGREKQSAGKKEECENCVAVLRKFVEQHNQAEWNLAMNPKIPLEYIEEKELTKAQREELTAWAGRREAMKIKVEDYVRKNFSDLLE